MWLSKWKLALSSALLAVVAACGGGGGSGGTGTLRVALTDHPACGYDEVNITVTEVRAHQDSGAADNDAGWQSIPVSPAQTIDLLDYTNGALLDLGQTDVPAGTYTRLRLVLADNSPGQADKNWIVLSSNPGVKVPLKTPSAQQSGLKINVALDVQANGLTDVVLDFDACKSVVKAGHSGQYLLKPVLRALARVETGVIGEVSVAAAAAGASVSLQQNGVVVRATAPEPDGDFRLQPVAAGTYTLVVATPGHATLVVRDVVVPAGQLVRAAPLGDDLDPPVSALVATLDGAVDTGQAAGEIAADVALLQPLTGGPSVRLIDQPVDADTGGYLYSNVALDAPRVAPWATGASLSWQADNGAAARFVVQATAGDVTDTSDPFTATAAGPNTNDFVFP